MADKICRACGKIRAEGSFHSGERRWPEGICKPCLHRPHAVSSVRASKPPKTRERRAEIAVRGFVKQIQNGQTFVYLVTNGSRYKIGLSTSVDKRMRQLDTASSEPIRLIAVAPGGRQLEQALHKTFEAHRTNGEWFRKTPNILNRFVELPSVMIFLPGYVTQDAPLDAPIEKQ